MLQEALSSVILPTIDDLIKLISLMAKSFAYVPMLSRTHGQVTLKEKTFTLLFRFFQYFGSAYLFGKALVIILILSISLDFVFYDYNPASFSYNFG